MRRILLEQKMRRILMICLAGLTVMAAAAQQPPEGPEQQPAEHSQWHIQRRVARLFRALSSLSDWDAQSTYVTAALEKMYERNGWTSEPDRFAMEMIREVNRIPPWKPAQRFDLAAEMMAERYGLDEQQQRLMRETLIRESNDLFVRHSGRIMQYAIEAIETRAAGEPFTPEQVARWAQLAEPVFLDSRKRMNVAATEFAKHLRPDQAEALLSDLDAANRRMDDLYVQSRRWADGDWNPADWGLEEDPIQTGAAGKEAARAAERSAGQAQPEQRQAEEEPGQPAAGEAAAVRRGTDAAAASQPVDDDAWAQYVRRFIEKYNLNEGQQSRAWRIYRDVKARGDTQRRRYGQEIEAAQRRAAGRKDAKARAGVTQLQSRLKSQLGQLYAQLKARLDRLPTRQQRTAAKPIELEPSTRVPAPVNPMPHDGP